MIRVEYHCWLDEFIRDILLVRLFYSLYRVSRRSAGASHQSIIREPDPLPAFIPIHCKVTSANGGNGACCLLTMLLQFPDKAQSAFGVAIAAISKCVNIYTAEIFFFTE